MCSWNSEKLNIIIFQHDYLGQVKIYSLFNIEWLEYTICLANFYGMLMTDVIHKMLPNTTINLLLTL